MIGGNQSAPTPISNRSAGPAEIRPSSRRAFLNYPRGMGRGSSVEKAASWTNPCPVGPLQNPVSKGRQREIKLQGRGGSCWLGAPSLLLGSATPSPPPRRVSPALGGPDPAHENGRTGREGRDPPGSARIFLSRRRRSRRRLAHSSASSSVAKVPTPAPRDPTPPPPPRRDRHQPSGLLGTPCPLARIRSDSIVPSKAVAGMLLGQRLGLSAKTDHWQNRCSLGREGGCLLLLILRGPTIVNGTGLWG